MTQTTQTTETPERKLNLGRLERLQRLLQYVAALVLLVFVGLIALAWTELRDLNARRDRARLELLRTEEELADATDELELKKKALDAAQSVNTVLSGVAEAYKEEHPDRAEQVTAAVRNAVEASITQSGGTLVGQTPGPVVASKIPPRVYIQIMRANQRARAAEVARRLQSEGFIVPGVENMERKGHRQSGSDVRFNPGEEMAAADTEKIRAVLGGFNVKLKEIKLPASAARPRHYELWLGDDFAGSEGPTRPDLLPGIGPAVTRPGRPLVTASPQTARKPPVNQRPPATQKTPDPKYPRRPTP